MKKAICTSVLIGLLFSFSLAFADELAAKKRAQQLVQSRIVRIRIVRDFLNEQFKELGTELDALKWKAQQLNKEIKALEKTDETDEKTSTAPQPGS